MTENELRFYWAQLPESKENAVNYEKLCEMWGCCPRRARSILQELSLYDDGSDFVLIRSATAKGGFYKTNDFKTMVKYRRELVNKGRSIFAPVKKIDRILAYEDCLQYSFENNLRIKRAEKGFTQAEICEKMKQYDKAVDVAMLSKFENGVCLPTAYQLALFARFYGCAPGDLICEDYYYL